MLYHLGPRQGSRVAGLLRALDREPHTTTETMGGVVFTIETMINVTHPGAVKERDAFRSRWRTWDQPLHAPQTVEVPGKEVTKKNCAEFIADLEATIARCVATRPKR